MRRLLRGLDALPRWLRWAVFLPLGYFFSQVVEVFVEILLDLAGLPNVHITPAGSVRIAVLAFASGVTVTLFPALLSPRPWRVGLVMFAVGILLRFLTLAYAIAFTRYSRSGVFLGTGAMVIYALGGGLGLYLIRRVVSDDATSLAEAGPAA